MATERGRAKAASFTVSDVMENHDGQREQKLRTSQGSRHFWW
jgi:hypothetical protein